jgi:hypothetical protein
MFLIDIAALIQKKSESHVYGLLLKYAAKNFIFRIAW